MGKTIIAHNIATQRKVKKITQQNLADKVGIPRHRIGSYEESRCEPNLEVFFKICNVIGVTDYESFATVRL